MTCRGPLLPELSYVLMILEILICFPEINMKNCSEVQFLEQKLKKKFAAHSREPLENYYSISSSKIDCCKTVHTATDYKIN